MQNEVELMDFSRTTLRPARELEQREVDITVPGKEEQGRSWRHL